MITNSNNNFKNKTITNKYEEQPVYCWQSGTWCQWGRGRRSCCCFLLRCCSRFGGSEAGEDGDVGDDNGGGGDDDGDGGDEDGDAGDEIIFKVEPYTGASALPIMSINLILIWRVDSIAASVFFCFNWVWQIGTKLSLTNRNKSK